jgi:hypothetical protein
MTIEPTLSPPGHAKRAELSWLALTLAATLGTSLVPLIWDRRYYFHGDTQIGAVGQWFHLGVALRQGHWPLLDPQIWPAGNIISEGQWGLFSPLAIFIALTITSTANLVVFCTVLKIGLLLIFAAGTFALCRSYRAQPWWSAVAGLAVTLGGVSQYLESPSWVNGQMVIALLPWAWVFLRRTARGANPLPALGVGYLIVTVGYVYGTMYLALVLIAIILDSLLQRDLRGAVRVVIAGASSALVAVAVYLPGMLTASVTSRGGWALIDNGRLQPDMAGLFSSMLPSTVSLAIQSYPAQYIAWFLPMAFWLHWGKVRTELRSLAGLLLVSTVGLLWVVGPNQFGPIRWPIRVMPLLVLGLVVLLVVLLSRARRREPPVRLLVFSLVWTTVAGYLVASRVWELRYVQAMSVILVSASLVVIWAVFARVDHGEREARVQSWVAAAMIALTVVLSVMQHRVFPIPPAVDYKMPSEMAAYTLPASAAKGDGIVVGNPRPAILEDPAATRDFVLASSWFLTQRDIQSVYSTIGFTEYNKTYCRRYDGTSCKALLKKLFEPEPTTGTLRVDLLSVSTLQIFRDGFSDRRLSNPPGGWSVAHESDVAVTWTRDVPMPPAGGLVWASEGTKVDQISTDARSVSLRVDDVPEGGGQVAFSRLAWPGYKVSSGSVGAPIDGYLLHVEVPASAEGSMIEIKFSPPGWTVEVLAWWMGVLLALAWGLGELLLRRSSSLSTALPRNERISESSES